MRHNECTFIEMSLVLSIKQSFKHTFYGQQNVGHWFVYEQTNVGQPWRRGLVVSVPLTIEETGAMGREIESRQGICRVVA
jgi:hypothetical protein